MKGSCRHCGKQTANLCSRCDGIWACNYRCLLAVMPDHLKETSCATATAAVPLGSLETRRKVVKLLSLFTAESVATALKLVFKTERVPVPRGFEVHLVPTVTPCLNKRRACTDGRELWVSTEMYEGPGALTRNEVGFPFPQWIRPHVMVILHEFGHLMMGHPFNNSMTGEAKELRADCWAARYVEDLKE